MSLGFFSSFGGLGCRGLGLCLEFLGFGRFRCLRFLGFGDRMLWAFQWVHVSSCKNQFILVEGAAF